MYDFSYHRPASVDEAVQLLQSSDDGTLLAGGHTLIPTLKQRLASPSDVIDLGGAGLGGISVSGDAVTIGAGTTHAEVAGSSDVAGAIPALARLAGHIGDPHVRARGTIGGSVANNDPSADYPAACVALGATIVTNEREVAADDFFTGMFETALNENEIITSVVFPVVAKAGYSKFPNPASRYAMVGVFVAQTAGRRAGRGDRRRVQRVPGAGDGKCARRQFRTRCGCRHLGDRPTTSTAISTPAPNTAPIWSRSWRSARSSRPTGDVQASRLHRADLGAARKR